MRQRSSPENAKPMWFKGVDFFPHNPGWRIISKRLIFVGLSWLLAIASVALLSTRSLNYGVDFKGGSLIEVQSTKGQIDIAGLRERLGQLGLGEVQVQGTLAGTDALIRIGQQPDEKAQSVANDKVKSALGDTATVRRIEVVGPAVSSELKLWGVISVIASLLGILLYVWFRFEWQFAVAGILALCHDVLITVGVFSLLWIEFDLSVVAAILTLAGYSINDTVVVFDRIRENLRKYKKMPLESLLDLSINETLSRTVLTSTTTFLAVLALYIFGTEVIHGFSFAMLFGIVIGTYSSIFVAAPLLLYFGVSRESFSGQPDKPKVDALSAASAKAAEAEERAAAEAEAKAAAGSPGETTPRPKKPASVSSPPIAAAKSSVTAPKAKPVAAASAAGESPAKSAKEPTKPAVPQPKPQVQGLKGIPQPGEAKPKVRL